MAKPAHLARLHQGINEWNNWRSVSQIRPDLRHAPLSGMSLSGYNFSGADCRGAAFSNSDLSGCQFAGANLGFSDLRGARLSGVVFSNASLFDANIVGTNFSGATMDNVDLSEANGENGIFCNTVIRFCCFIGTNLAGADFANSTLHRVSFEDADLRFARFHEAILEGVELNGAWIWETITTDWKLADVDCSCLRMGREGGPVAFEDGEFGQIFGTRTIRIQMADDKKTFEAENLQNLIYFLGRIEGSFLLTIQSDQDGRRDSSWREVTIKVESQSVTDMSEVEKLNSVINGLRELQKDKDARIGSLEVREASLRERLTGLDDMMPWNTMGGDFEEKRRLTIAMFDLTGSSHQTEEKGIADTAKFWGIGVPLVRDRKAKYINTWGDALVACFEDVDTALDSAWELISALRAIGIRCRAGLHHGDVWIRYNSLIARKDITGRTVHLAARLEPEAEPGTVLVSKEVKDMAVAQKLDRFEFQDRKISFGKATGEYGKGEVYWASVAIRKTK